LEIPPLPCDCNGDCPYEEDVQDGAAAVTEEALAFFVIQGSIPWERSSLSITRIVVQNSEGASFEFTSEEDTEEEHEVHVEVNEVQEIADLEVNESESPESHPSPSDAQIQEVRTKKCNLLCQFSIGTFNYSSVISIVVAIG
jgi:hypothetical protein